MDETINKYTKTAKLHPYATVPLSFLFGIIWGGVWHASITGTRFTPSCATFYIVAFVCVICSFVYFSQEVQDE